MKTTRNLLLVLAVFAACALLFAATALAADPTVENNTVKFNHSVDLINANGGTYYGPDVTFTYSIAPAEVSDITITDSDGNVANVKPGPPDSVSFSSTETVTTGSIVYGSTANPADGTQTYSSDGEAFTKSATLYFDMSKFTTPGVYRYKLEDTTTVDTLYAAGIVRPTDYDGVIFLDVYVENDVDGYKITNARLVTDNTSLTTANNDQKTDGFDGDDYYTFDFELTKEVTGGMGDKTHPFPFTITIDNNDLYYFIDNTDTDPNAAPKVASNETTINVSLKHGESFHIYGLCPKATVEVTEANNTADTYSVTITGNNNTAFNNGTVQPDGTITATITKNETDITNLPISTYDAENSDGENGSVSTTPTATTAEKIKFENKYDTVSPTGLALRYGPFVLLLAGAVCFFIVGRKRKETKEESDSI